MADAFTRRDFMAASASLSLGGLGGLAFLNRLAPVSAADAAPAPDRFQFSPEIEPLVRLIEETEQAKLLEKVAGEIKGGTGYQDLLAALLLAGVRSIRARPIGSKFHAVLAIHSAHQSSRAGPDQDRWLPLFWALDDFKTSQARNVRDGNWIMAPVAEAKMPPAHLAKQRFVEAMDNWDTEAADRAISALVRTAGENEISELFWAYGARDFHNIAHKAIFTANGWRTLRTIGWRHAEGVLRSLAYALLDHNGPNPPKPDGDQDRPWRDNRERAKKIRARWQRGKADAAATKELLGAMRTATTADACGMVVELLNKEIDPSSIWDGLFLSAGELLMRQPGIVAMHSMTALNALRHAYDTSGVDETRKMVLLQATAFVTFFRQRLGDAGKLPDDPKIDELAPQVPKGGDKEALASIFDAVDRKRTDAAALTLGYLKANPRGENAFMTQARRLLFAKGTNSHDYKFCAAALEDFHHVSPEWRNRYLAASTFWLRGSKDADNALIQRAKNALGA